MERQLATGPARGKRLRVDVLRDGDGPAANLADDVRAGLSAEFKELPPKYFYDERGSRLFERITELPEYYPTRAERAILEREAGAIVRAADPDCLVELGAGSAAKTRCLLVAMRDAGSLRTYVPVDISTEITRDTAIRLVDEFPGLGVHGIVCDFDSDLERLSRSHDRVQVPDERRMIAFLGGTIGNFAAAERHRLLKRIAALLGPEDTLLLGTDLVKDRTRLEAAYNDSAGVTAEFNKNVLHVLNRELEADFDLDAFEHRAFYDEEGERIDIRLRSLADQKVTIGAIDMEVWFGDGEEMRTELSCKFTPAGLRQSYSDAGLELIAMWTDDDGLFALSLARRTR